jgi:phosphonate transport system substrate-binding protein
MQVTMPCPAHAAQRRRFLCGALAMATAATFATSAFAQACEDPKVLKFSIIPTQETIRELTLYKPVMDLLSKNTGKKIEFYMPTSYASVVEALLGKWVDVAVLGPESYVLAHGKDPSIEVFATYYKKKDGVQEAGPGYKSRLTRQAPRARSFPSRYSRARSSRRR